MAGFYCKNQDQGFCNTPCTKILLRKSGSKALLQKLQIKKTLMQNSIISRLFVVVAWHYEKIKSYETRNHQPRDTALYRYQLQPPGILQQE